MDDMAAWFSVLATIVGVVVPLGVWTTWITKTAVRGLETTMDLKFETVDVRLRSLEGDVMLVKQHLIGNTSPA
jgi:hypothetical protein